MADDKKTLLVVDDDPRIQRLERQILEREGYAVVQAIDGQEALQVVVDKNPVLVLLDVHMPRLDGFTVCQRVREFSQVPIVVVTGKGSEEDKIRGFEVGADDYVTKPFSPRELVARVKAVLRRASLGPAVEEAEPAVQVGDLQVDFSAHKVTVAGQEITLTATEYRLLAYLARNAGRVLTPDQILERVWGEEYLGEAHLLRVTLARLRQKLGDDAREPRYILTKPGIGYSLTAAT